ncbi:MAG: ABC transporter permease [Eubacteriales bacterium]|nr:ABC transporter permease [Eubacteriales bacterium]
MKVKNRAYIRTLSRRQLKAGRTRNLVAIAAIILTTLLFTSLFTLTFSINASYQEYAFRQMGGYGDGTFKDIDEEKINAIAGTGKIDAYGLRTVCGMTSDPPFSKKGAEVSYMDENCTRWSYAMPTTGHMPKQETEIAMDTEALRLLGIPAKVGEKVTLTYMAGNPEFGTKPRTDTFTLSGYWKYDPVMPCHYFNVSKEYVQKVETDYLASGGEAFRTDMNVMMPPTMDLEADMQKILTDLGYQWEDREADNCVRIGVNWGLTTENLQSAMDAQTAASLAAVLLLILLTGYLIIYNIFQISISTDIRFYGLLKTIGATPRQLKRMVRLQALYLGAAGIPVGCLAGYGVGVFLTPIVFYSISNEEMMVKNSASPLIFLCSALFAFFTLWVSSMRPARKASKISPVEAVRYTETVSKGKKKRATKQAGIGRMAWRNLGRNRMKTVLVVASLSLSLVLLNAVFAFIKSFDMEKYLSKFSPVDFVVGSTEYLVNFSPEADLDDAVVQDVANKVSSSMAGCSYTCPSALCWVAQEKYLDSLYMVGDSPQEWLDFAEKKGDLYGAKLLLEGMDTPLLKKLKLYEGSLEPMAEPGSHVIAMAVEMDEEDDKPMKVQSWKPGDTITVAYVDEEAWFDSRTHTPADETTPEEYRVLETVKSHDVTYTVCALVEIPYKLSFRYTTDGFSGVLPADVLKEDSRQKLQRLYYAFDTPSGAAEADAEQFLSAYTGEADNLSYESKAVMKNDFQKFKQMFALVGGMLCIIIGVIGILNFFNAMFTGIHARRREFAMMQSVGMTGRQLKQMLMAEGFFYALATITAATLLSLILDPLAGNLLETMFWFCTYRFTLLPILLIAPIFFLGGSLLPLALYRVLAKKTIVERLREAE